MSDKKYIVLCHSNWETDCMSFDNLSEAQEFYEEEVRSIKENKGRGLSVEVTLCEVTAEYFWQKSGE